MNKYFFAQNSVPTIYSTAWINYLRNLKPQSLNIIYQESLLLSQVFQKFSDLPNQLSILTKSLAKKFIEDSFSSFLTVAWMNFLFVLIDDYQIQKIDQILIPTIAKLEKIQKFEHGEIYTVIPLTSIVIQKIEQKLSVLRKTHVLLMNKIDLNLIGGVRIQINSTVWDNTVMKQLNNLRAELLSE